MSDFLAIAAVRGKVLHLVDFDRPVWMRADNPIGDRIVPDLENMLADALLFFCHEELGLSQDIFATKRGRDSLFDLSTKIDGLDQARQEVRGSKKEFVLLAHFEKLESIFGEELGGFSLPVIPAAIDLSAAKRFGIG